VLVETVDPGVVSRLETDQDVRVVRAL